MKKVAFFKFQSDSINTQMIILHIRPLLALNSNLILLIRRATAKP